jgi:hypothetical protein
MAKAPAATATGSGVRVVRGKTKAQGVSPERLLLLLLLLEVEALEDLHHELLVCGGGAGGAQLLRG